MKRTALLTLALVTGIFGAAKAATNPVLVIEGEYARFVGTITYPANGTSSSFEGAAPYEMELTDSNCIISVTSKSDFPLAAAILKDNLVIKSATIKGNLGSLMIRLSMGDVAKSTFRAATWGQSKEIVKKSEVLAKLEHDSSDDSIKGCTELEYTASAFGFNNVQLAYTFLDDRLVSGVFVFKFISEIVNGVEDRSEYDNGIKTLKTKLSTQYGTPQKTNNGDEWKTPTGKVMIFTNEDYQDDGTKYSAVTVAFTKNGMDDVMKEIKKRSMK